MSNRQPPPDEKRIALLERRPRRLSDVNWREIVSVISFAGAAYLPVAMFARLAFGVFDQTLLASFAPSWAMRDALTVVGAAGVGYLWFRLIAGLMTCTVFVLFGVTGTPVRQDWLAGFLGGATAIVAVSPLTFSVRDGPAEYLLGPVLAVLLAQAPTTFVATRELKRFVRQSFWSADAQIIASKKSMNIQISLAAMLGAMTVASLFMGLLKASGFLELPLSRLLLSGFLLQLVLLPASVWASHRLLRNATYPKPTWVD